MSQNKLPLTAANARRHKQLNCRFIAKYSPGILIIAISDICCIIVLVLILVPSKISFSFSSISSIARQIILVIVLIQVLEQVLKLKWWY